MEITRIGSQLPVKGQENGSLVQCELILYFSQMNQDVQQPPLLHSNLVQELHGIHIRSVKH